jgi:hypothetical protein
MLPLLDFTAKSTFDMNLLIGFFNAHGKAKPSLRRKTALS